MIYLKYYHSISDDVPTYPQPTTFINNFALRVQLFWKNRLEKIRPNHVTFIIQSNGMEFFRLG